MLSFILMSVLILVYLIKIMIKPSKYPPGPLWLPFMGCSPELKKMSRRLGGQHLALSELSQKYNSDIIGLKLGNELVVAVLRETLIKEVLRSDDFECRPDTFFMRLRCMGTRRGITGADGELWKTHRNFLIRHLRNLGFGKKRMDIMILEELNEITNVLKSGSKQQIGLVLAPAVLSILWGLTSGNRISREDSRLLRLMKLFHKRSRAFDMSGGILSQFPWLRYIFPERTGYNLIVQLNKEMKEFFMETINEHNKTWTEGRDDDFIYSFLTEMKTNKDPSFTFDQLVMICMDIFMAGTQTTSDTLDFAILMMIMYPEIQEKAQKEIDAAYQNGILPEYANRHLTPYVEAVLNEVIRMNHVVPITGPRRVEKNIKLDNYIIPKNSTILISNYSVNYDSDLWGDPNIFRPERFLDVDGNLINYKYFFPFNIGKRKCLGDTLARSCIYTFFTGILKSFKISLSEDSAVPKGIPISGITLTPERYTACFTKRQHYQ